MPDQSIALIAERLGRAQKAVVLSLGADWGPASSHRTARRMFWGVRGGYYLVEHKYLTDNCWRLTRLGTAVRDYLLKEGGGR